MIIKTLLVKLGLDADDFDKGLEKAKGTASSAASAIVGGLSKVGGALVMGALGLATAGALALGTGLGIAVSEAMGAQTVMAQTEAVIRSTGGAAGMTAQQIADMSTALSLESRFADDSIQTGANLLLTFKNIGGETFPRATQAMVDMATAMGTDVSAGAVQLGKALNDPVLGISALSRVGIQFTEDQKALITSLVEAGDVAGAQAIILNELESQFGGSAAAAAETFGGKLDVMKNRLLNVAEAIGGPLLTLGGKLIDKFLLPVVPLVEELGAGFTTFMETVLGGGDIGKAFDDLAGSVYRAFGPEAGLAVMKFGEFIEPLIAVVQGLVDIFVFGKEPLGDWSTLWENLAALVGPKLAQTITDIIAKLSEVIPWVKEQLPLAFAWLQENEGVIIGILVALGVAVVTFAATSIAAMAPVIAGMLPIILVLGLIVGVVALAYEAWQNNWGGIRDTLTAFWTETGEPIFNQLKTWLEVNIPIGLQVLSDFWTGVLLPAIQRVIAWYLSDVLPAFLDLWAWLSTTIPAALTTLQGFWDNTLLPALKRVQEFIADPLMPLFTALVDFFNAAFTLALTAMAGLWEKTLQPALKKVSDWVGEKLQPVLEDLVKFWDETLGPKLTAVKEAVLDKLPGVFQSIRDAVGWVIGKIGELTDKLSSVKLPWWMTPGSPTPWETGLRGVSDAMDELGRRELPRLTANLRLQPSLAGVEMGGGGSVDNSRVAHLTVYNANQDPEDVTRYMRLWELLE